MATSLLVPMTWEGILPATMRRRRFCALTPASGAPTLRERPEGQMNDTPEDSKLTRTKSRWAELGKFLTGMSSRPEDSRLPPGQHLVRNWPVLDLGQTPNIARETWRLDIAGA